MNGWDKIKYAVFGDRAGFLTGLRPIEAAAQRGDMEVVAYYKEHGSKLTDAKGKGL